MTRLDPGDTAPPFTLTGQDETETSLSDLAGRQVLLYFYPKADTPGCIEQSCAVRDARAELESRGVVALGVSPDAPGKQKKFDDDYGLGFPLLADSDHAVAEAYGVWGEKKFMGKTYIGVVRSSFLIDEDGRIQAAWYGVKPDDTVPNALGALAKRRGSARAPRRASAPRARAPAPRG
jgi:peroxiredoxin Q/BCP